MKNGNRKARGPAKSMDPISDRQKLMAVLERFNIALEAFDSLRSDAHEKHIAARSLQRLEHFYFTLFTSSEAGEVIQQKLPGWGRGYKFMGKLASIKTLRLVKLDPNIKNEPIKMDYRESGGVHRPFRTKEWGWVLPDTACLANFRRSLRDPEEGRCEHSSGFYVAAGHRLAVRGIWRGRRI